MHVTEDSDLRWTDRGLEPAAVLAGPLLVADSWLVADGAARAADEHWARFGHACGELGVGAAALAAFRSEATAALPASGRWFPRIELTMTGLGLRVRPAPPLPSGDAIVTVAPPGDPRRTPRRKGPDLELLIGLRDRARTAGADELLLCDIAGTLREGALSSLLWWEGDALCTTPDEHTLPGVTRGLLLAHAHAQGIEVRVRSPRPEELAGREVWLTDALQGLRAVGAWLSPVQPAGAPQRARAWREALERHVR